MENITFPNQKSGNPHDHYSFGRDLGSGAFSRVVLGTCKTTNQEYAIKIVDKNETDAKDMYKELFIMSQLNHPNIVNYTETFVREDGFYVVLELITGGELFDRIIELQRYTEKDATRVLTQALLGLNAMHEKGFAHRDIKPENLLLSSKSSDANVKVADFGFSIATKNDLDLWDTLGTPPYMAPEIVILRNEDYEDPVGYGRPVDVWALGVCLYILLSGVHPYQQPDDEQMLEQIESGYWPGWKRETTWARISDEAKDLVKNMMHPVASQRLTVTQCLQHPWLQNQASDQDLGDIKDALKSYQARKKMKGAILGIIATNKMKAGFQRLAMKSSPRINFSAKANEVFTELQVKVIAGKSLAPKDYNGKSDPYIVVSIGAEKKFKSKSKKATLEPQWDETFTIPFGECARKVLDIQCWDADVASSDEFMGSFSVPVDSIPLNQPVTNWYKLGSEGNRKGVVSGEIQLEFSKKV